MSDDEPAMAYLGGIIGPVPVSRWLNRLSPVWRGDPCLGCDRRTRPGWMIGEWPDDESSTVILCDACMESLVATYHQTMKGEPR